MGCGIAIVKQILIVFNVIFMFAGVILLTAGILFKLRIAEFREGLDAKIYVPAVLLIVIGTIVIVVSFFGCCGAINENQCMVTTYAVVLAIILVLHIVIAVLAFVYGGDTDAILKQKLQEMVDNYYKDKIKGTEMDAIQKSLECCGVNGPRDYLNSSSSGILPSSCCIHGHECKLEKDNTYYTTGCFSAIENYLAYAGDVVGGISIGIAAVEIAGIVFACCLASSIKHEDRGKAA